MKNIVPILLLQTFIILMNCATNTPKTFDEADELAMSMFWERNDAIINEIVKRYPNEPMAIWATYDTEYDAAFSEVYETKMAQHGLLVVTRTKMRLINREFEFQWSGMVNENDVKSYGQLMGVSKIILIEAQSSGNVRDFSVMDIEKGIILYSVHLDKNLMLQDIMKQYKISYPVQNEDTGELTWTVLTMLSQPEYDQAQICRAFSSNAIQYFQSYKYVFNYANLDTIPSEQNYNWATVVQIANNGIIDVALRTQNGYYELYFSNEPYNENFAEIGDFRPGSERRRWLCKFINDDIDNVFNKMEKALNMNNDRFSQRSKDAIKLAHIQ